MPIIKITSVSKEKFLNIAEKLQFQLASDYNTSVDNVMIQITNADSINMGKVDNNYPFVEIQLFQRPIEQQAKGAKTIADALKEIGYPNADIYYTSLEKERYFCH